MTRRMLIVLFLAGMLSRCVAIAHGPVVARVWPRGVSLEQIKTTTSLELVFGVHR